MGDRASEIIVKDSLNQVINPATSDNQTNGEQITKIYDKYDFSVESTPMGEMKTAQPTGLVGGNFNGTILDPNFWDSAVTESGTITQANGQVTLNTSTTADSTAYIQSVLRGRYTGGSAIRYRTVVQLTDGEAGTANNIRRWGAFDTNDGALFELNGTTFNVVTRKNGVDTAVASANWNGTSFTMDMSVHTYEIYWTNSKVWFVIDEQIVHIVSASTTTWTTTTTLPIRTENNNTNGLDSDIQISVRVASIYRLGQLETQPRPVYQAGITAGNVLKYGAGNLHELIISGVANNSVITLYDNTAASGTIIWSSGSMGSQTQPFSLDFQSCGFGTGLTLVISGANSNVTTIYE